MGRGRIIMLANAGPHKNVYDFELYTILERSRAAALCLPGALSGIGSNDAATQH
jgi:hypothetical protein